MEQYVEKGCGKTLTTILKASCQKHRSWQLYSNEKNGLQQFQMESCQTNKRLKDEKKKKIWGLACVFTFSGPVCKHTMITASHVVLFQYSKHSAAPHST
jgi:hypothetical protein